MRILGSASSRRVPWKNGLGATLELASDALAPGGEWTWRLSIADVPSRTPFSSFPGVDRLIACLDGPGLALERAGSRTLVPSEGEALQFPGEEDVVGLPLGPDVRDVNLMLRRDRWRGRMRLSRGRELSLDGPVVIVHLPEGSPALSAFAAERSYALGPGCTLLASGRVAVPGLPGSVAVACELTAIAA